MQTSAAAVKAAQAAQQCSCEIAAFHQVALLYSAAAKGKTVSEDNPQQKISEIADVGKQANRISPPLDLLEKAGLKTSIFQELGLHAESDKKV